MSNIEKIRQEIERLENMDYPCDTYEQATGFYNALDCLSDFIDSLPEEKPSEDLEEASEEYADKHGFRVPYDGSNNYYDDVDVKASKEGFIAGAEWQKEQMMMKGVEKHCHTVEEWIEHIKNADALTKVIFSEGPYNVLYDALNRPYRDCYDAIKEFGELCYQTARQEMMRDAVEGEIVKDFTNMLAVTAKNINLDGFKFGDKVKIIIVKQDDRPRD